MFDIYAGEIPLTTGVLFLSAVLVLPLQLFLCFKARSLRVRLVLPLLFLALAVIFFLLALAFTGFQRLALLILALLPVMPLAACGIAWLIWALLQIRRKS